jgi:peptidoglycan-associated lipoprotein
MRFLVIAALLVPLAGCGERMVSTSATDQALIPKPVQAPTPPVEEVRITEPEPPPVVPPPVEPPPPPPVEVAKELPPAAAPAPVSSLNNLADVFFDYDRHTIRDDAKAALEANARLLRAEQGWRLVVEGHCDERGTLEYNLVLGERRAKAVQEHLADLGVPISQVQVISYGKERPFCQEHNQDCWQKNRRAHFVVP